MAIFINTILLKNNLLQVSKLNKNCTYLQYER